MTFLEFADVIDAELEVRRYPNQRDRWTAQFRNCEVKDGVFLAGVYGTARDPALAIADYVRKIAGQRLVFDAESKRRREYVAPATFGEAGK